MNKTLMALLVRMTVQLQQIALRLSGLLVAALAGLYLVAWATDPPPVMVTVVIAAFLLFSVAWHSVLHVKKRAAANGLQVDLGFFSGLTVLGYGTVLQLPGGLNGSFYALIYVVMMASAAYARPIAALSTVVLAALLEIGVRTIALGQSDWSEIWPRLGFLLVFAGINAFLFRAEIARVRRISQSQVEGELSRLRDVARNYRLDSSDTSHTSVAPSDDFALQSAVGEVQHAAHHALLLLAESLHLQSAALLCFDEKGRLFVFEGHSPYHLSERPINPQDGIISAALSRREAIAISGKRAAHHCMLYQEPQVVGALSVTPLYEQEQVRGMLVADRRDERPFSEKEQEVLALSGDFLVRAMQNERVFSRLERANREQAKLYRAASAFGSCRTEAQVIETGVESARDVASFDFAAVTLFHKKGTVHEICAVSGEGADHLLGRSFRHNAGLVSMAIANRHALPYRGEYEPARQMVFARGLEPPKMPSLLVLPLLVHERVLGTLVLGSSERHAFSESVRPALEMLASHMAVSLSNARLLKRLEEQATTDGMTGLLNKRTLINEGQRRLKAATRFKKPLSLLVTDIDHFKKVNDTYGHDVGDVVIKGLGEVLRRVKRDTDLVGRFGGEEFVIVCEQTDEEGATNLAERIRRELEATTFQTELGPLSVTCSVGVAPFPAAGRDWDALFKATDEALYVSKRAGRNRVTVWKPGLKSSAA